MSNMPKIKLFCDTGNLAELTQYVSDDRFSGFTTNPSLIAKEHPNGINYLEVMKEILKVIPADSCISFEVVSDDREEMLRQAREIYALSGNIFVKIPVVNPDGTDNIQLTNQLIEEGIKVNLTCVADPVQLAELNDSENLIISVFAGRIYDTLQDAQQICRQIKEDFGHAQILWASMRELYHVKQAADCGCDIITVPTSYIPKFCWFDYSLDDVSRLSSEQFLGDAKKAGLSL